MYQRREYKDEELVSTGLKTRGLLLTAIHQAAEKQKARSTSAWLHEVVLQATAKALGVDPRTLDYDTLHPMSFNQPSPEAAAQAAELAKLADRAAALQKEMAELQARVAGAPAPVKRRR